MSRKTSWGLCSLLLLSLFFPLSGSTQTSQVTLNPSFTQTSPPSPVGSGARAMGTGGAFIAIADDATAANWNPAGLINLLTPEASLVTISERKVVEGEGAEYSGIDHISLVYPFSIASVNMVTSVNYQRLYNFHFKSSFSTSVNDLTTDQAVIMGTEGGRFKAHVADTLRTYSVSGGIEKIGALEALSPAMAIQVTPRLSVGFTYNFWNDDWMVEPYEEKYKESRSQMTFTKSTGVYLYDDIPANCTCNGGPCNPNSNSLLEKQIDDPSCMNNLTLKPGTAGYSTATFAPTTLTKKEEIEMEGENFNIGILLRVSPRWTMGAVYRSEFEVDMDRKVTVNYINFTPARSPAVFKYDDTLRMPASYGMGAAFRYSDEFTVTADATRTEWDRLQLDLDGGPKINPVNGLTESRAAITPTWTYRLGAEYLLVGNKFVVPLRGGVFYDPEPARHQPDDFWGVAAGTGLVYNRFIVDLTYWYRSGKDVTLATGQSASGVVTEVDGDISQQMIMLSAIFHFK